MAHSETKQGLLNRLAHLINQEPMGVGRGSSVPSALFDALLTRFGLDTAGSMPVRGKRLVEAAGLRWEAAYDSRHTDSGGGSTVTLSGLEAMETAVKILLGRRGVEERNRLLDAGEKSLEKQEKFDPASLEDARMRVVASIVARRGQGKFRKDVLVAYNHQCAITGTRGDYVLEAAHIVPYLGPMTNVVSNGLLLRSDLHTLFDLGLIGIKVERHEFTIVMAPELEPTEYWQFKGKQICLPADESAWPSSEALEHHRLNFGLG